MNQDIPGTVMFDGDQAQKGYALNRMCFSFNSAENGFYLWGPDPPKDFAQNYEIEAPERFAVGFKK